MRAGCVQRSLHRARLEVQPAAASPLQPAPLARDRGPLSAGHLDVESHRTPPLLCEVTKNWAGHPLDSYETILKYLRTTRTATGLRVRAHLVRKTYKTGVKVTEAQMREHTEQPPPQMELHHRTHVTKNGSYFCAGPKWIPQNRVILPQSCGKFSRRRSDAHGRVRSSS